MRSIELAAVSAILALGGCATIFTGTTDTLTFAANVPGVKLTVDGQYRGELPLTIVMSRNFVGGQYFLARFERPGYVTQEFKLYREFNTVAILDVSSIPTSPVIDILTGSLLRFSPTDYHVQMLTEGQSASSEEFQRVTGVYRFALVNFREVQKDLARGGGERLRSLASAVCGGDGDPSAVQAVYDASLRSAPFLLGAATAPEFVQRVGRMLEQSAELGAYRI
jgi:hypothetical protein